MATSLYLLKHHRLIGPGWLLDRCSAEEHPYTILTVTQPDELPMAVDCQGVVLAGQSLEPTILAGKDPLLRAHVHFVRSLVALGVPFLGIDRGAQILARAMLARPLPETPAPGEGVQLARVPLTDAGQADPLLGGPGAGPLLGLRIPTVRFSLPDKGALLAGSADRPEAFRFGDRAWGIYPHVELTAHGLADWLATHPEWEPDPARREAVIAEAHAAVPQQKTYAYGLMDRFLSHCQGFCHTATPLAELHLGPESHGPS